MMLSCQYLALQKGSAEGKERGVPGCEFLVLEWTLVTFAYSPLAKASHLVRSLLRKRLECGRPHEHLEGCLSHTRFWHVKLMNDVSDWEGNLFIVHCKLEF